MLSLAELLRKRGPIPRKGPLTAAELAERKAAARASAEARHRAETSPSVRQGSTSAPSAQAVGLFRQGQSRPDTRPRRGPWDTRATEAPVGAFNATFKLHLPKAYQGKPDRPRVGPRAIAAAKARAKQGIHSDLDVVNPRIMAEAQRHPQMRAVMQHTVGVVRDHQDATIQQGHARKLIPEGTHPGTAVRAYKHAALRAIHRAGLGDYDTKMDDTAKKEFTPLVPFMRYAHRRVFDHLNQGPLKGKWSPFREEFGQLYRQKKFGKLTGKERMRMRPVEEFIKRAPFGNGGDRGDNRGKGLSLARRVLLALSANRAIPAPSPGMPTRLIGARIKHRAQHAERHFGLPALDIPRPPASIAGSHHRLRKGLFGNDFTTDPARQVKRAMRFPRIRTRKMRLRLNTQRNLRRVLNGGVTRQERWQLGAGAFKMAKRAMTEKDVRAAASEARVPSKAQADAGNYQKGHIAIGGLRMAIETPKGRMRRGRSPTGRDWQVRMPAHYGYIKGTEGADGDHVDAYLGPLAHEAHKHDVHLVNQHDAETKRFDEHKALLGFPSRNAAVAAYDAGFSDGRGPERRRAVHSMPFSDFKDWLSQGDTTAPMKKGLVLGVIAGMGARRAARGISHFRQARKLRVDAARQWNNRVANLKAQRPHIGEAAYHAGRKSAMKTIMSQRKAKMATIKPRRWTKAATLAGGALGLAAGSEPPKMPPLYQSAAYQDDGGT